MSIPEWLAANCRDERQLKSTACCTSSNVVAKARVTSTAKYLDISRNDKAIEWCADRNMFDTGFLNS